MSGLFTDAYGIIIDALDDAGLPVIDDVRNLRPPSVIVDPPSFTVINNSTVTFDFPVSVVMPPPGNRDALIAAMTLVDQIVEIEGILALSGSSGVYTTGGQELPSYQLTVQITVRREP